MGTPQFSCGILATLHEMGENVVAVVTQPDKKVGRKQELQETPVKVKAKEYNIPVLQPVSIKESVEEVLAFEPDCIVTAAYGQIIPEVILNYPTFRCINVHASLLPKYRGGAPIHMAIIEGEEETGISLMYMAKKMDAGDILVQKRLPIALEDTTSDLFLKLEEVGKSLIKEALPKLFAGELQPTPQNEADVTYAWNISKEQEFVSFKRPVKQVYNHIRGLIAWPVGHGFIDGKKMKFHQVHFEEKNHNHESGKLIGLHEQSLQVACEGGYIYIDVLQMEGKNKVSAREFYNGAGRNLVGCCFD